MEYKGKVYAKINGLYIECTETIEQLQNRINELEATIENMKAANEWISVDDELPENGTQIVMKNTEWVETMFYTSDDEESLKTEYTNWKPIN